MNDLLNTDSGESSVTDYEWIWWTTAKTLQYLKGQMREEIYLDGENVVDK